MAYITGRQATFAWSGSPAETTVTTNFNRVLFEVEREWFPTTPPGYLMKRYTPGILNVTGVIGNWHDSGSATPPIPGGTSTPPDLTIGTLTIAVSSGETYAFKACLVRLSWNVSTESGGPPSVYQYAFISNAQATTDTITVA